MNSTPTNRPQRGSGDEGDARQLAYMRILAEQTATTFAYPASIDQAKPIVAISVAAAVTSMPGIVIGRRISMQPSA